MPNTGGEISVIAHSVHVATIASTTDRSTMPTSPKTLHAPPGCGPPDTETGTRNTGHEGTAARQCSERQHSPCSGPKSSGGGSLQDAGSVKEAALLKAAVESLRTGIRDKEDAVTDLVRCACPLSPDGAVSTWSN